MARTQDMMKELKSMAEQIRLEIHLAGMEARDKWRELEPRLGKLEQEVEDKGEQVGEAVEQAFEEVGGAIRKLWKQITGG
jgi:ribosome recycling factor